MKVESNGITIHLEQDEVVDMWNIIMFALDWQSSELTKDKPKMNEHELKLANELQETLDKIK